MEEEKKFAQSADRSLLDKEQQEELLRKADKEYAVRKESGWQKYVVDGVAIVFTVFMLAANLRLLNISNLQIRFAALAFVLFLGFMIYPFSSKKIGTTAGVFDLLIALIAASPCLYLLANYTNILKTGTQVGPKELILGSILLLALVEIVRRSAGWALPVLAIIFFLYGHFGEMMPGVLNHKNISFSRLIGQLYLGTDGIFGTAFGVACTYIFLFVFFGALINQSGMGQLFNDLANSIAGDRPGGPAKVAIISSGLMGMINGSGAANVVTTGTFTIPLMKRLGYKSSFAGAVEAVASCGGQIMPPVMGAAAFVMAEYLGCSYSVIMIAALLPAILYYFSVYMVVDLEAKRLKLNGADKSTLPKLSKVLLERGVLFIPVIVLIIMMLRGRTAIYSVYFSMAALVIINIIFGLLSKFGHGGIKLLTPRDYIRLLASASKGVVGIMLSCAIIGVVVGVLSLTGLGLMLANTIIKLSGGYLFTTMLLTMVVCIILGMGLPITPSYIIVSTIAAPALIELHVPLIAAHMFVLYFCAMSAITPPVALAAFAAAGICGDSPWNVGWQAVRLGIAGFLIPFAFVYGPQLLFVNYDIPSLVWTTVTCCIGLFAMACGSIGYFKGNLPIVVRCILIISAIFCVMPETVTDLIGIALLAVCFIFSYIRAKGARSTGQ